MKRSLIAVCGLLAIIMVRGQSVLSQGNWYKIGVTESGIHKLDAGFLQNLGIPTSFDPRTLKLYGNGGGGILPQLNSAPRPIDLIENPIREYGTTDGSMEAGDYFLFYGNMPDKLEYEGGEWQYEKNIYSDTTYYFITYDELPGKRMESKISEGISFPEVNTFDHVLFFEPEDYNILDNSGRNWVSQSLTNNVMKKIEFETPGAVDSIKLDFTGIGRSDQGGSLELYINDSPVGTLTYESVPTDEESKYDIKGMTTSGNFFGLINSGNLEIGVLNKPDPAAIRSWFYIDRIVLSYKRRLTLSGSELIFSAPSSLTNSQSTIRLSAPVPLEIWDITNRTNPTIQEYAHDGTYARFGTNTESLKRYIAFTGSSFPKPSNAGPVANQDIRSKDPKDGLIITVSSLLSEANRLAEFHRVQDNLDIEVVLVSQIYNEFSSGMQDITAIRDAIRHYWQKNPSFRYVTLFGDCSYDYKYRIQKNKNLVPVYESRNSLDPVLSYSSDDYYGFMEPEEGEWIENSIGDHTLEIGIGRIPVHTEEIARDAVNKIIRYATSLRTIGRWKNNITYVADDGDYNIHMADAEDLATFMDQNQAQTSITKIFLDMDHLPENPLISPMTRSKLKSSFDRGAFVIDYLGHGSEEKWAVETILDKGFIKDLTNRFKMPLVVTATCEFGRYDDPYRDNIFETSGAEDMMLHPNGGAIAVITTTRPVYAQTNYYINAAFHASLFEKIDGEYPRLGDIIKNSKNYSLSGPVNRNFALLGDPMLRLNYPDYDLVITEIGDAAISEGSPDTLSALESVLIRGEVRLPDGSFIEDFSGVVEVTVFDQKTQRRTLGQKHTPFTYSIQENILFNGQATIRDGIFSITAPMPKNISYNYVEGKITMYAQNDEGTLDASGAYSDIIIGGSEPSGTSDNEPPVVHLYLNDTTFQNGDKIGGKSLFIARVSDESGINMSGLGIAQDIVLTIDDEKYIMNNYYLADIDTYQHGTVIFPLNDLAPGRHIAHLKIWDIHNNSAEKSVEFVVSDTPQVRLFNVLNYPNPAGNETTFRFEHDRIGDELKIAIYLYDMQGNMFLIEKYEMDDTPQQIDGIKLDLNEGRFKSGIYMYRLEVKSTLDQAEGHEVGKLIIYN